MFKLFPYRTSANIPFSTPSGVILKKRTCFRLGQFATMSEVERDPETGRLFQPSQHWFIFIHSSGLAICRAYDKQHAYLLLKKLQKLSFTFRKISPSEVLYEQEKLIQEFTSEVRLIKGILEAYGKIYHKDIEIFSSI